MRHGEILRGYSEVLRVTSLGAGTNWNWLDDWEVCEETLQQGQIIKQLLNEREMKMYVKVD